MKAELKTPTLFLLALFACLLLLAPALAQMLTVTTDKDFYGPGERIVVSGTAVPNADVTVQLFNPNNELVAMDYARSGADGKYSMSFVIPAQLPTGKWILGTYTVRAFVAGAEAKKTITIGLKVVVAGKVVDSKGAPIAGATVTVGPASATTGADGAFEVSLAAEGTYAIKVEKAGYYAYSGTVTAKVGVNDVGTIALTSYEDKIGELEKRIVNLENSISDLQKSVSDLTAKVSGLASTVDKLSSTLDAVKKDLESAKSDIKDLRATVAIATDLKKSVEALTSTVDGLKKSVDALQAMTAQLPILYALALIGIIIAIVAIVQVYRKIAK
jgi:methyl-accepting chemotaxis protein